MKTGTWDTRHGPEERKNLASRGQLPCYSQLRVNQHVSHKCRYKDGHRGPCRCCDCSKTWRSPKVSWKISIIRCVCGATWADNESGNTYCPCASSHVFKTREDVSLAFAKCPHGHDAELKHNNLSGGWSVWCQFGRACFRGPWRASKEAAITAWAKRS